MNKFEFLVKLIVPAFLLIVWALQQIFGKEAPATPRAGRPPGPPPGGLPPARRPGADDDDPFREADAALRSRNGGSVAGRPASLSSADIIILSSETIRRPPPAQPRPGPGGRTPQRRGRPKPQAAPASPAEAVRARSLSPSLTQSLAQSLQRPAEFQTIAQSLVIPTLNAPPAAAVPPVNAPAALAPAPLRAVLNNPARLREALILSEILNPPIALRRR